MNLTKEDDRATDDSCRRLFLCGDVMTGRGLDQILPHPCDPTLHEPYVHDARRYWEIAESAHGSIPRPVSENYIWGDAIEVWDRMRPDVRIVNLETAITTSDHCWKGKEIHYRMSPQNIGCLKAARIDCCALANNHVLDWGYEGLTETLQSLQCAGVKSAGAGESQAEAQKPAVLDLGAKGRVLVFSFGSKTSGIPAAWAAGNNHPGVNLLSDFSMATIEQIQGLVSQHRREKDVVVASLHWGGNWGYGISPEQRQFAQQLVSEAGVDIVHGHSSHHVKGIEVYRDRLILYGCGDFLTDYEGISGYEDFRGDLALMYFATVEACSGQIVRLELTPLQVHRMQLRRASSTDVAWLQKVLDREGASLGTRIELAANNSLIVRWDEQVGDTPP